MKKFSLIRFLKLALAVLVSFVALVPQFVANAEGNVLNLILSSEPPTIDPAAATDTTSGALIDNVFEGLTDVTPEGEVIPALAESWEMSEDGMTYTFHLRQNAVWSNGDPVTAHDLVYGWLRVLNPETLSQRADFMFVVEGAKEYNSGEGKAEDVKVKAVDDYTFEVTLVSPTAYFTELVTMYTFLPVNQKVAESNPDWATELSDDYVTNGPFLLTEHVQHSHYVLTKNETYWDKDNVALSEVNVQIVESSATANNEFVAGTVDYLGSPYGEVSLDMIEKFDEHGLLNRKPTSAIYWYMINNTDPVMQNVNIRKALGYAIDRQSIVDNITKGGQVPALGYVPPVIPGFEEDRGYFKDADFDTAREFLKVGLEELGMKDPSELTVHLSINTSEAHSIIAQFIQETWAKELGINTEIDNSEWQVYLDKLQQKDYQVGRLGWTGKYNDATTYLDNFKTIENGNNQAGWENEEYTALLDKAMFELDPAKRLDILKEAEALIISEMPVIPIYFYSNTFVKKENLKGMEYDGVGRLELKRVYFE